MRKFVEKAMVDSTGKKTKFDIKKDKNFQEVVDKIEILEKEIEGLKKEIVELKDTLKDIVNNIAGLNAKSE